MFICEISIIIMICQKLGNMESNMESGNMYEMIPIYKE